MFGFAQWDSPVVLALEVLLSIAILVVLVIVARRVNARADEDRQRYLQSRSASHTPDTTPARDDPAAHDQETGNRTST